MYLCNSDSAARQGLSHAKPLLGLGMSYAFAPMGLAHAKPLLGLGDAYLLAVPCSLDTVAPDSLSTADPAQMVSDDAVLVMSPPP